MLDGRDSPMNANVKSTMINRDDSQRRNSEARNSVVECSNKIWCLTFTTSNGLTTIADTTEALAAATNLPEVPNSPSPRIMPNNKWKQL